MRALATILIVCAIAPCVPPAVRSAPVVHPTPEEVAALRSPGALQECLHMVMHCDQVVNLLFEVGDVQLEFVAPVLNAIPVHGAFLEPEPGDQLRFGGIDVEVVFFGIAQGHVFAPEVVVKMQVQQGAVHVQEYRVDFVPGDHDVLAGAWKTGHLW